MVKHSEDFRKKEGRFSLESLRTHIYLDCLTLWRQSSLIDFAGAKHVLIFKDFKLLFLSVSHKRWGCEGTCWTIKKQQQKRTQHKYKNVHWKRQNQNKHQLFSLRDFIWCHSQQALIPGRVPRTYNMQQNELLIVFWCDGRRQHSLISVHTPL